MYFFLELEFREICDVIKFKYGFFFICSFVVVLIRKLEVGIGWVWLGEESFYLEDEYVVGF